MSTGLRERQKQQTRVASRRPCAACSSAVRGRATEAIRRAAMRLFAERGFDATTITDIAPAADVAPRTSRSCFGSRAEVVFADFETAFTELDRSLRERQAGTTALQALRA